MILLLLFASLTARADPQLDKYCGIRSETTWRELTERLTRFHRHPKGEDLNPSVQRHIEESLNQIEWFERIYLDFFSEKICPEVKKLKEPFAPRPGPEPKDCKTMVAAFMNLRLARIHMGESLGLIRRCFDGSKMPDKAVPPPPCEKGLRAAHLEQAFESAKRISHNEWERISTHFSGRNRLMEEQTAFFGGFTGYGKMRTALFQYLNDKENEWRNLQNQENSLLAGIRGAGCEKQLPPNALKED